MYWHPLVPGFTSPKGLVFQYEWVYWSDNATQPRCGSCGSQFQNNGMMLATPTRPWSWKHAQTRRRQPQETYRSWKNRWSSQRMTSICSMRLALKFQGQFLPDQCWLLLRHRLLPTEGATTRRGNTRSGSEVPAGTGTAEAVLGTGESGHANIVVEAAKHKKNTVKEPGLGQGRTKFKLPMF